MTETQLAEATFDATRVARFLRSPAGALRVALVNVATGAEFGSLPLANASREELARVMGIVGAMRARLVAAPVTAPEPPACVLPEVVPAPLARRHHGYAEAWGKDAATRHLNYVTGYTIKKTDNGVTIQGDSPDGKLTGTCDRCGTAISDVFVFSDDTGRSLMHVGIDCAGKMGVPLDVLKQIAREMRGLKDAVKREQRRLSREEATRVLAAERRAMLEANKETVNELESLSRDPHATEWDQRQIGFAIKYVSHSGSQWLTDPQSDQEQKLKDQVESIQDRLALSRTSQYVGTVGKTFTGSLRAYRPVIVVETAYGPSFRSFLTDDRGNAFFFKGSKPVVKDAIVRATWTVKAHDLSRDGFAETTLERPRKGVLVIPVGHASRTAPTYAHGHLVGGEDPEEYAMPREEPF